MIAITNGKVLTITRGTIENGTVLIKGEKIIEIGREVKIPEDAEIIDAKSKFVLPGFVDAHTHLGIYEEGVGEGGEDTNENVEPITPELRALDGINPNDLGFRDAIEAGITTCLVEPGSANVIGGTACVIKTYGNIIDEMVIRKEAGIKIALGENPKRVYKGKDKSPATRMGIMALLRNTFVETENYMNKQDKERKIKFEVLSRLLKKEIPAHIHAHRSDDLMTGIRVASEFGLKAVLVHCTEGYKIVEEIKKREIPVCIGPLFLSRSKIELKERSLETPGILSRAGIKVAITSDHPILPIQFLPLSAGIAVREGMDADESLKAITINASEILGVDDRIGSIEVGKDADLVILSHHPFEIQSKVEMVIVNGKVVYKRNESQRCL
ncbi:MAG: amidohydrolase [bacterium]|nr:amidohydrolase [bacterium]